MQWRSGAQYQQALELKADIVNELLSPMRKLIDDVASQAGLVLFNSWALDGFTNVFWRELPLQSLALPATVLIGWAIVFFIASRQLTTPSSSWHTHPPRRQRSSPS
jgi:hypothetical protein